LIKVRGQLSSFGLTGKLAVQKISTLSGGQKSRVVFATITWSKPQILLLDEPTNHLDMETINVLISALQSFKGGIILTSHDQHLIRSLEPDLWWITRGKLEKFKNSFEEYLDTLMK